MILRKIVLFAITQFRRHLYFHWIFRALYTHIQQQQLTKHINIEFVCEDTINNCAAAFQATSVQFSLVFPETNTLVQDVVSTFKIGKYDRLECLLDSYVQYNSNDNSFIIATTPGNCVLQYQQNKMATASLFVYPDYELSKQFSLSGISSLSQLVPLLQFNCDTDFVDTDKRVCNRIMKEFQSSLTLQTEVVHIRHLFCQRGIILTTYFTQLNFHRISHDIYFIKYRVIHKVNKFLHLQTFIIS
ncbi:Hypothetical_protein [Hexamita inflata]|uniref:Hypothetical_protein n=1 Tax=Hexamita inflata TaxID=28002 RepID=A0ABP1KKN5_9EUKA